MMKRRTVATVGLAAPAVMALGMSADTSYRFLGDVLKITNPAERGILTGTAEAAIIALALYAWATGAKGAAWIAYAVVLVQAIPAFQISGGYGGMVRTALGPVLLVVLMHLLLGLELRMTRRKPSGLLGAAWREARERLTAYLGIGRRGADSAAIARSRAADRAVVLADKVASARSTSRRHARLTAALAEAMDRARHGLDAPAARAAEAVIVARVVRRKSVAELAVIKTRHDWTETVSGVINPDSVRTVSGVRVSETGVSDTDAPVSRTALTDTDTPAVSDTRPVRRTADGSMTSFALSVLTDNPAVTDGELSDAILDRFGQDSKPNSVYVAIKRARKRAS